jgi:hypothetical protein
VTQPRHRYLLQQNSSLGGLAGPGPEKFIGIKLQKLGEISVDEGFALSEACTIEGVQASRGQAIKFKCTYCSLEFVTGPNSCTLCDCERKNPYFTTLVTLSNGSDGRCRGWLNSQCTIDILGLTQEGFTKVSIANQGNLQFIEDYLVGKIFHFAFSFKAESFDKEGL